MMGAVEPREKRRDELLRFYQAGTISLDEARELQTVLRRDLGEVQQQPVDPAVVAALVGVSVGVGTLIASMGIAPRRRG